jgi:dihydrofolate synthase/folylpolyglutamate synthase
MSYQDTLSYLSGIQMMGVKPGLETTGEILTHLPLDKPLSGLKIIQVAGTNGKGSTTHFLSSIFRTAGYKVGQFTSPHLTDVRERIVIDNQKVSEELFSQAIEAVRATAQTLKSKKKIERMPTYFEYTFLASIYSFSHRSVEIVILEVGLGGRWDATTAITPDVTVITTISRDHTRFLGNKLSDIAAEKAGIIKPAVPIVCGCGTRTTGYRVIRDIAKQKQAPFFPVFGSPNSLDMLKEQPPLRYLYQSHDKASSSVRQYTFEMQLNGQHQANNAATAIKAVEVFTKENARRFPITHQQIIAGIQAGFIPGRIETIASKPPVILDGGHNIQSIKALVKYLELNKKRNLTLLFGVLEDKNYSAMIRLLQPFIDKVVLTRPQSDRALSPEIIEQYIKRRNKTHSVLIQNNLKEAYRIACQYREEILITGSFYLVGAIRQILINSVNLKTSRRV